MQASSFEKAIEAQFDCLVKKVIKCEQKNIAREEKKHYFIIILYGYGCMRTM